MLVQELPKPWVDLQAYKRTRLLEAKYEAEIAGEFLREGLIRNAAGKAFQAWKALVAALAVDHRDKLRAAFPGNVKLKGGKVVERADWLIAVMPSTRLREVAQLIGGEIAGFTSIALDLHQYQYNGPDRELLTSSYRTDEEARRDVELLLEEIDKVLKREGVVT